MRAATSFASSRMENDRVPDKFPVGMKVLLVDDDLTCLTVVKRMLLNCKYDVTTCSEATRALSLLRENKGAFDLIISDVHMPDMDGFKLLELVGLEMDLPVIMMSVDTKFNVVMKGVSHGACDFLAKPVRMEELQNIWQHVVRRKWLDCKEVERSGSVEETDHNRQVTEDTEYASSLNDGTDSSWKYQKKKRDTKEDDDGELESVDPSSSKKPRVVWSVELHQQFVNAVNQLGIDKAVPKRILELMNVHGLTRENVASHLQKFRLYLKRLSGVAQHQNGLNNTLCGASSAAKGGQMGRLDLQALAVSGQISPQTLAALQDELLGRPSRSIAMSALNQPIVQQSSTQGNNCVNFERGITFGQPLLKGQAGQPLLKGQALSSFPVWSSNNLGAVGTSTNHGGVSASRNCNMLMTMLPLARQQTLPAESNPAINVQPSCLIAPTKSSDSFQVQGNTMLLNQESAIVSPQSSASYPAANTVVQTIQDSTSLKMVNNSYVTNPRSTTPPSQLLNGISVGSGPGILNEGSIITSQPLKKSQIGTNSFLINQNSMIVPSQLSSTYQLQKGLVPVNHNTMLNTDNSHINYNPLPAQINDIPLGQDGSIDNLAVMGGFSVPVSKTSDALSSTSSSTSWQLKSSEGMIGHPNSFAYIVPNSCNVETNTTLGKLHDRGQGRSLGFVGKTTCLPSCFSVDDVECPTNELTNSNIYTGDDAYFINQDIYGALRNGPCATTSFK